MIKLYRITNERIILMKQKNTLIFILNFLKSEMVLSIAALLAIISSFFVHPDMQYIGYIDFRTLSLLVCLMAVTAGLQDTGVFQCLAERLLTKVHSQIGFIFILVMLCFFTSMFITNDVALITFVPFTFTVLSLLGKTAKQRLIIPVVVLQTLAANLGSMLTPIGNPQNLYLYGILGTGFGQFILIMLPYTATALILLCIHIFICCKKGQFTANADIIGNSLGNKRSIFSYLLMFAVCLLSVTRVIDYKVMLVIIILGIIAVNYKILFKVDYTLILTFIAFFIFIGNMSRIESFSSYIGRAIYGRECITGILASQVISNVPATLLLSGFTNNYHDLIIGVNLGGLGTLIASMASLISFKYIGKEDKTLCGRYLLYFTVSNLAYLAILFLLYVL